MNYEQGYDVIVSVSVSGSSSGGGVVVVVIIASGGGGGGEKKECRNCCLLCHFLKNTIEMREKKTTDK